MSVAQWSAERGCSRSVECGMRNVKTALRSGETLINEAIVACTGLARAAEVIGQILIACIVLSIMLGSHVEVCRALAAKSIEPQFHDDWSRLNAVVRDEWAATTLGWRALRLEQNTATCRGHACHASCCRTGPLFISEMNTRLLAFKTTTGRQQQAQKKAEEASLQWQAAMNGHRAQRCQTKLWQCSASASASASAA